jgi:CLIP-associating protein 1/2
MLVCWETNHLEKNLLSIQNSLRKGICDADQDARLYSRKAFWTFHNHFPKQAQIMLDSFDAKTHKLLHYGTQNGQKYGSMKNANDQSHDIVDNK